MGSTTKQDDRSATDWEARAFRVAIVVAVFVPLLVLAVVLATRVGPHLAGGGDNAANELHLRDIGSYPVLLGPYSRDGWSHPGPALYYLLVLGYRLAGSTSVGMYLGALAINGGSLAVILSVSRRFGGTSLFLLNGLGLGVLVHHLGPLFMSDPWNPYVTVLPFGALMFCCWAAACGARWMMPAMVFLATFCVQTHIGTLPLVLPLVVWTGAILVVKSRQGPVHLPKRELIAAGVVAAVMWAPPVLQQLTARRGNLAALLSYFRHPDEAINTLRQGYAVVAHSLSPDPEWLHRLVTTRLLQVVPSGSVTVVPVGLILFAVASVVILRRGPTEARALSGVIAVCIAASIFAIWRTPGPLIDYRLRGLPMISLFTVAAALWFLWLTILRLPGGVDRAVRRAGGVTIVLAAIALAVFSASAAGSFGVADVEANGSLAASLLSSGHPDIPARRGQVLVTATGPFGAFVVPAMVLWLEERGYDARVPLTRAGHPSVFVYDDSELLYGEHRVCDRSPVAGHLLIVFPDRLGLGQHPGYRRIAGGAPSHRGGPPTPALYVRKGTAPEPVVTCRPSHTGS